MNTILVIARLTFREAVRRKIVLAALILGLVFLIFYSVVFYFVARDMTETAARVTAGRQFQGAAFNFYFLAGMYVVNFLGIATAALISADSLAGEIQSGTIQAVVTKPIHRRGVVLGKWLGNAILLLLYLLLMGGGTAVAVRLIAGYDPPGWYAGLPLVYLNSLIIMSLTLAFSSRLSTLATGGAVFGCYGIAFLGGWVERIGSILENDTAVHLGILSSLLLPSEAVWNKASALMSSPMINFSGVTPFTSASEPSLVMMVYTVLYLLALLAVVLAQFARRDL